MDTISTAESLEKIEIEIHLDGDLDSSKRTKLTSDLSEFLNKAGIAADKVEVRNGSTVIYILLTIATVSAAAAAVLSKAFLKQLGKDLAKAFIAWGSKKLSAQKPSDPTPSALEADVLKLTKTESAEIKSISDRLEIERLAQIMEPAGDLLNDGRRLTVTQRHTSIVSNDHRQITERTFQVDEKEVKLIQDFTDDHRKGPKT